MTNNLFIKKKKLFYRWDISLKYSYCFLFIIETARYIWKCFTLRSKIKTYDYFFFPGNPLLYASMAVERLGGWQDPCVDDGSRHRPLFRSREEAEEEDVTRLFMGESSVSQLVGLQVLPLWSSRSAECGRWVTRYFSSIILSLRDKSHFHKFYFIIVFQVHFRKLHQI